ncbi:glutamine--fructose-6-phosphate transaminase (isomerizing) [Sporanaerobium hydrogeniformans]|uniref:Glutamine--fructose-6-phosphate transaminase (Isomerizing) n=1 Tax=Sporanaerobium hydrogeniformans TaxID=3072179 RepID=A0AC61DDL8_9FIRM|nr:glutamine--fructose-6-phosphate transaminase (isomerizing) [Sporanaerobium hydrogeniformans]PHV71429.1 glutamine--fructose-6-phosphate transaminase (isomerizing) [Sporanaerobium hydrogeniformans]
MCGIVGYIGKKQAVEMIMDGLAKLEYRGYDSAGVAIVNGESVVNFAKKQGRLSKLEEVLEESPIQGCTGVGHTRWATHGAPSDANSHPHLNTTKTLAVVHNGIIENYMEIKEMLLEEGYTFQSETDTEVAVHLIDKFYEGDLLEAVYKAVACFRGAYALGVVSAEHPDELVAVRKESPLIVGLGEGEYFIASDVPAILKYTRDVYYLENDEVVYVKGDKITILDATGQPVNKQVVRVEWDIEAASKGGFEHFMMKEIYDQPQAIRDTLLRRLDNNRMIHLDDIKLTKEDLEAITKMYVVACGTASHAGLVGKYAIEKLAKIPVEVDIASEFRYSDPFIDEHTLLIVVSQSGETADTLAAMKLAKSKGARVLAITNVVGSSVAREAHDVFYTWAGPEIAVASTKAYTAQMIAFYMIALDFAYKKGTVTLERYHELIDRIEALAPLVEKILENKEAIKTIAEDIKDTSSAFYLGRGIDYTTAREAALKLKEISYLYTEAFAAGELKHGPIALIDQGTPVLCVVTQKALEEKMISNIKEVKARGAFVIAVTKEGHSEVGKVADDIIYIPETEDLLMPVLSVIPTQLIAYYVSIARGNDVDKPRNLAKSVTVE